MDTGLNMVNSDVLENEALDLLASHGVHVIHLDGKPFVSLDDYNTLLRGLVGKIVSLTRSQNEEVMRVAYSLETIRDVLAQNYPDVLEVVQSEINQRLRAN